MLNMPNPTVVDLRVKVKGKRVPVKTTATSTSSLISFTACYPHTQLLHRANASHFHSLSTFLYPATPNLFTQLSLQH